MSDAGLSCWENEEHAPGYRCWPAILEFLGYDPLPTPMTLSERLGWLQRHQGWEHGDLACELRVGEGTLTRWKAGLRPWSRRSVEAIRTLLEKHGLPCDDLMPRGGIAEHLVARRLDLHLSQGEAAREIRVDRGTYRGWERHGKTPSAPLWPGVLAFLGYDPHPAPANVAEKLQAARRILGITQMELAERLGVTQGAVAQWEVGLGLRRSSRAAVVTLLSEVPWPRFLEELEPECDELLNPRA